MSADAIVADVGATSTRVGIFSRGCLLPGVRRFPTPSRRDRPELDLATVQDLLFDRIAKEAEELRAKGFLGTAVGIAFGAVVDREGVVKNASILWLESASGFDIVGALERRLPWARVTVLNDVAAAAWAHAAHGRFAFVTVSSGLAVKVFDDALPSRHKVLIDPEGLGGEMGHVRVSADVVTQGLAAAREVFQRIEKMPGSRLWSETIGDPSRLNLELLGRLARDGDAATRTLLERIGLPWCECGNVADLASYASGPATLRLARRQARANPVEFGDSALARIADGQVDGVDTAGIARAASMGDAFTLDVLRRSTRPLALRILQLASDLGLRRVLVGGGFAKGVGAPWLETVREQLVLLAHDSGWFTGWSVVEIRELVELAEGGDDDGLIGVGRFLAAEAPPARVLEKPIGENRVVLRRRPTPECGPEEFLLRPRFVGICSTDLQILRGERTLEPRVLGHECVAEVIEIGERVEGLALGQVVSVTPNNPCDEDDKLGHDRPGVFQDVLRLCRSRLDRRQVIPLPAEGRSEWVLLEMLGAVVRAQYGLRVGLEEANVLVLGAGVAGLLHVMLARASGARRVLLAGRSPSRLELAAALGVIDPSDAYVLDGDLVAAVQRATGGRGVDAAIVALAGDGGVEIAPPILSAVARGGCVHLFGGFPTAMPMRTPDGQVFDPSRIRGESPWLATENARGERVWLTGSRGGHGEHVAIARDLVVAGRVDLAPLITHVVSFEGAPQVLDELSRSRTLDGKSVVRVVIDLEAKGTRVQIARRDALPRIGRREAASTGTHAHR